MKVDKECGCRLTIHGKRAYTCPEHLNENSFFPDIKVEKQDFNVRLQEAEKLLRQCKEKIDSDFVCNPNKSEVTTKVDEYFKKYGDSDE